MNNPRISEAFNNNLILCPCTVGKIGYHKFSLRKPRSPSISPSPTCIYYPFAANTRTFLRVSFLTTRCPIFTDEKAKSLLALTYTPKWDSECELQPGAKIGITFKDSPRVWPAFGNLGGAMEYLLCKGAVRITDTKRLHAPNAGQTDYFVQRSVQAQELFLTPTGRLRHAFLSIIRKVVVPEAVQESPGGIMFDSLRGIIVATSMILAEHIIYGSVSISIRKPLGNTRWGLIEFCGALWQDIRLKDKRLPLKAILDPFERRSVVFSEKRWLPVILKLKNGRESIDQCCKNEFERILRLSWSELHDMSAQFEQPCKKLRAETIDLPLCPDDLARIKKEINNRQGISARPNDSSGPSAKKLFGGNWNHN